MRPAQFNAERLTPPFASEETPDVEPEEQKPTEDEARPSGSKPSAAVRFREEVFAAVRAERERQENLWGEQNHPSQGGSLPADWRKQYGLNAAKWKSINDERVHYGQLGWDGILLEEVFEALAEEDPEKLRAELVQSMAVILNWLECIERRAAASGKGDAA